MWLDGLPVPNYWLHSKFACQNTVLEAVVRWLCLCFLWHAGRTPSASQDWSAILIYALRASGGANGSIPLGWLSVALVEFSVGMINGPSPTFP